MPAWLTAGQADQWPVTEPVDAMAMLVASALPAMEAYRVSRDVNTPRNNTKEVLGAI